MFVELSDVLRVLEMLVDKFETDDERFALEWAHQSMLRLKPAFTEETIKTILDHYFQIGDSTTYELTRSKEAFAIGTMSLDDFDEWSDENTSDLATYIFEILNSGRFREEDT